jgi:hypothetical protein
MIVYPREYLNFATAADKTGQHRGLYAKDVPPPAEWEAHVRQHLHPTFLWKVRARSPLCVVCHVCVVCVVVKPTQTCAQGDEDLMGTLPPHTQPESVMCYIGFHGTRTPAHKVSCNALCGTLCGVTGH